jgi:tripartite-type tricarboxylate transporter receptor subunit TctC
MEEHRFMKKRTTLFKLAALGAVFASGLAQAQANYPSRTVVIVNPWAAAGPAEALLRPIAERLTQRLGQPFVIETKAGANGTIGSNFVARAKPDGYTLLFGHAGPIAISPGMAQKPPYDTMKDFAPITQVSSGATVLVVRADFQAKTLKEFMDYAKANPGKVSYGSVGPGSTTHIAGATLARMLGTEMIHVPYKGSAPINTDLIGGAITSAFVNIAGAMPLIKEGRLRALATTTLKRPAVFPDLPTVHEVLPGFEINSWYGLLAPAGTPPEIVDRLHKEVAEILKQPDISERMITNGNDPEGTTPQEFSAKIKADLVRWADAIRAANVN